MRKTTMKAAVGGASALILVAACSNGDDAVNGGNGDPGAGEDAFPTGSVTIIVPAEAGGGLDNTARQLQPFLTAALGVRVNVDNFGGAGTTIGVSHFLRNVDADCHGLVITNQPILFYSPNLFDVDYTFENLRPIGVPESNPGVWRVANDAPWQTFEEFIEDARQRPGEITASTSSASINANVVGIYEVADAAGVEFNIVPFDGGGGARNALARGEVDFTHAGAYNSLPIASTTRVLAVQEPENLWPEVTDGASTVNDALGIDLGTTASDYALQTHRECAEEYPDRFAALVEAWEEVAENEDFLAQLESVDALGSLRTGITPEELYEEFVTRNQAALENFDAYGSRFE